MNTGGSFLGDKMDVTWKWRPVSTGESNNAWSYASAPPYISKVWSLTKFRDNFILLFISLLSYVFIDLAMFQWITL
jgi:hypothetical protein